MNAFAGRSLKWLQAVTVFACLALATTVSIAASGSGEQFFRDAYDLQKAGKLTEAVAKYEAGLKLEPKNALAHYFLGDIYAEQGDARRAKIHLGQSLKLDPQGPYSGKAQERLDGLSQGSGQNLGKSRAPGTVFRDCPTCPEMVVIPSGSFVMGSPPSEAGRIESEGPTHVVTLAQPFALGRTEVTRGQFAAFVTETGYQAGSSCFAFDDGKWSEHQGLNWQNPGYPQEDSHPVVCINWNDAKAYVDWLMRKSGKPYRLPSEAEWEYATRAGTTTARYWGDSPDQACSYANVIDSIGKAQVAGVIWAVHNCNDNYPFTAPAGSFKPNAFGLHDMIGNAWEWVEDCWNETYIGAPIDGRSWSSGTCEKRVLRGGSWYNGSPQNARSARRIRLTASDRGSNDGFRLARMLP